MNNPKELAFDAIVILAGHKQTSSLKGSPYAAQFKQSRPVIIVHADLRYVEYYFEHTQVENVLILHVYAKYASQLQANLIAKALNAKSIIAPLLWIDNALFIKYAAQAYAVDKIYSPTLQASKALKSINGKVDKGALATCSPKKLNILILYEAKSCIVSAIKEHLESYAAFSSHAIHYAVGTAADKEVMSFTPYDVIVIHFSLRLSVDHGAWTISPAVRNNLKKYSGLKVAFIQDEYDTTNTAIEWLKDLGIQLVFTCVPEKSIRKVYSAEKLPYVQFVNNLTGYVPERLVHFSTKLISQRPLAIAYRGRNLPFWYGNLGQEKEFIGKKMKQICQERGINEDIEWDESKRIYGEGWYDFLASAKATLGTESGANVFDFDGALKKNITLHLQQHPNTTYQEIDNLYLGEHEGKIQMNQISPKIFESICLRTALILFEGSYSNVLIPEEHYIVLKKDFSNIDEVLAKVEDDDYLTQLTNQAFQDIVVSGRYSYQSFVRLFDETLLTFGLKNRASQQVLLDTEWGKFRLFTAHIAAYIIQLSLTRHAKFLLRKCKPLHPFLYKIRKRLFILGDTLIKFN
jgi:hypothetical protein